MNLNGMNVSRTLSFASNQMPLLSLRKLVLANSSENWVHLEDQERRLQNLAGGGLGEDAIVFGYSGSAFEKAALNFWQTENGYEITGIVPVDASKLPAIRFYDLMDDFLKAVIDPISRQHKLEVELGKDIRDLAGVTSAEAARALFSLLVQSEPERVRPTLVNSAAWHDFIIKAHESKSGPSAAIVYQWLIDGCGFDDHDAKILCRAYEDGLRLLAAFSEHSDR